MLPRTSEGRVILIHRVTGQSSEHWPVDANEILKHDEHDVGVPVVGALPSAVNMPTAPATLHPLGMPLVSTHSSAAAPGTPFVEPKRTGKKG